MRLFSLLFITLACGGLMASSPKKQLTLDDIYVSDQFQGKTVSNIQWLPNGKAFTFTRANQQGSLDVWRHEVASGKETLILAADQLEVNGEAVSMSAYQTTGQQTWLLITGERKQIWRHSYSAPYYLYNTDDRTLVPLAKGNRELQNVDLSPDGKTVAYVRESNLYVADVATGESEQLTHDGSFHILNGIFDWVYEEEFGRADAFRWSPDGKKIAYWRMDQTHVKSHMLLDELPRYSEPFELKYPKVGERNALVKIGVVEIASTKTTWMDIGKEEDIYIPRIAWSNDPGKLAIQRLNRAQNHLELLLADATTGKSRVILEDRAEGGWISVSDDYVFLTRKQQFLYSSEKSGWRHLYLADYDGKQVAALTQGSWEVASVIGVDEQAGYVYFNGKYDGATEQGLFRVKLSGGKVERIAPKGGWHTGKFAPDYQHYVGFSGSLTQPTQVILRKTDGSPVRTLEANHIPALAEFEMVYPEIGSFKTSDGTELNSFIMKPVDFDPSKKYPVLVFGYGGPGSQQVVNRWGTGPVFRSFQRVLWHQYLTEQGYIVFCLDNRGTGGRGRDFKHLAYGDISKWAVHDQIEGAKYLASLPFVDASRIGFWGWSGGGYLTCMLMTRGADYFKVGVAVASVGDFRNYDTIWTERYMGLLDENKAGYDAADVLSYTDGLKGHLLMIHGTGDDNVHPGNTWQMIESFVQKNKQIDMMMYPNRNHRISGGNTSRHLFTKITNYITEHL